MVRQIIFLLFSIIQVGSDNVRERAGLIIVITGIVLLVKPNFDVEQMIMSLNYIIANYWPIALVFIGVVLINPKKRRPRSR
ncbi:MAG: hypothetical protein RR481_08730 [Longicatena sp.]